MAKLADKKSNALGARWYIQDQMAKASGGDMVLSISPETVAPEPTDEAWTRTVTLKLVDTDGNVHTWCNGTFATILTVGEDSEAGVASIASANLTFVNGVAEIVVSGTEADWLDEDTDTLTIANITILGYTITGGTSVETFTA